MLQRAHEYLLILTILLLPFVTSLNVNAFGGVGREGSFYPLFLGVLLWTSSSVFFRWKIYIPSSWSFIALLLFLAVTVLSGIVNIDSLAYVVFQGVAGPQRYLLQIGALGFYFVSALYMYQVFLRANRDSLQFFSHYLLISCIFSLVYSSLEVIVLFGGEGAFQLLSAVDSIFRNTEQDAFYGRIRSLTSEASYFGMYSAIVFPWLLSLFIEYKGWKRVFAAFFLGYFLLINILTFSRTSYAVLCIEGILYMFFFRAYILHYWKQFLVASVFFLATGMYVFATFMNELSLLDIWAIFDSLLGGGDGIREGSNMARYGSAAAAFGIFFHYPILGVGFGSYGFYAADYYPLWAQGSVEILNWSQNVIGGVWPPVHNLYARLLAETGVIGFLSWISFCMLLLREECVLLKRQVDSVKITYWRNLVITTVGVLACGFNVDGFRLFAMWLLFSIVWYERTRTFRKVEK